MDRMTVRVHFHDDQDDLLVDAIGPLCAAIPARAWFVRHWLRGPHVRLTVVPDVGVDPVALGERVRDKMSARLASHPSSGRDQEASLLGLHRRLAAMEAETGPITPWEPDNTVLVAPDAAGARAGTAADLIERAHAATQPVVLEVLDGVRRDGNRLGPAFDLVVATVHAFAPGGARRGFVSCRSHAEAFLAGTPEGPALRPAWERHSAGSVDRLAERVRALEGALDGNAPGTVGRFVAALEPVHARARELAVAGALDLDARPPGAGPPPALDSAFHRALSANERWQREVAPSPWFAALRLVLNATYLQLTRIGVAPVERFRLCHLVADAVERAHDVDALELIRA